MEKNHMSLNRLARSALPAILILTPVLAFATQPTQVSEGVSHQNVQAKVNSKTVTKQLVKTTEEKTAKTGKAGKPGKTPAKPSKKSSVEITKAKAGTKVYTKTKTKTKVNVSQSKPKNQKTAKVPRAVDTFKQPAVKVAQPEKVMRKKVSGKKVTGKRVTGKRVTGKRATGKRMTGKKVSG